VKPRAQLLINAETGVRTKLLYGKILALCNALLHHDHLKSAFYFLLWECVVCKGVKAGWSLGELQRLIGIASLTANLGIRPMAAFVGKAYWLS
jgi:hypothetical protein